MGGLSWALAAEPLQTVWPWSGQQPGETGASEFLEHLSLHPLGDLFGPRIHPGGFGDGQRKLRGIRVCMLAKGETGSSFRPMETRWTIDDRTDVLISMLEQTRLDVDSGIIHQKYSVCCINRW